MTSTRSATIQAAILVASGAALAVASLWGSRLPERLGLTRTRRRPVSVPASGWTGREILGPDEALRRWGPDAD